MDFNKREKKIIKVDPLHHIRSSSFLVLSSICWHRTITWGNKKQILQQWAKDKISTLFQIKTTAFIYHLDFVLFFSFLNKYLLLILYFFLKNDIFIVFDTKVLNLIGTAFFYIRGEHGLWNQLCRIQIQIGDTCTNTAGKGINLQFSITMHKNSNLCLINHG